MSFSQTNTTNPLEIKKISRREIDLLVNRDTDGQAVSFSVNALTLDEHQLPEEANVRFFAYSKTREQRIDLGTIGNPHLGLSHPFEIDTSGPYHFRLIVCVPDGPNIIAACEGLRATEETDEGGRQHLLPVEPSDNLEERLWELRCDGDGEPVLYVNKDAEINMLARLRGDPLFQSLILPQAVEQVLFQLSQHPNEEGESWQGRWNAYLSARGIEPPDDPDEIEACLDWARVQAQSFAVEHSFLTKLRYRLAEADHDA